MWDRRQIVRLGDVPKPGQIAPRFSLPTPLVPSIDRQVRSWSENSPSPELHSPLPADPTLVGRFHGSKSYADQDWTIRMFLRNAG
jgi:hypothetical protein